MNLTAFWSQYRDELSSDPFMVLAFTAAIVALATTPFAFVVLGRTDWFKARRGRVLQRPAFSSVVVGMLLVMGIPAIFAAFVVKSRSFDRDRYEFDPNRTWSVLEQGRGYRSVQEADAAVKAEMERLSIERKNLVDNVKKLDEAMLGLRTVAGTSVAVSQRFPSVLQSLAGVRKSVGLDGPQQLLDYTAPPVELRANAGSGTGAAAAGSFATLPLRSNASFTNQPMPEMTTAARNGLSPEGLQAELSAVAEPQRKLAAMLPCLDLPTGWSVGKSGDRHIETFNADNLYEKIDGRAESFIQYSVKGMAYAFYHPTGDPTNELQLYIFEMADSLKALGKYGSEKPDDAKVVSIGTEGYTSAGSTLFYSGRYYTQIVSTQDNPKFGTFALELAQRVSAQQQSTAKSMPEPPHSNGSRPVAVRSSRVGATPSATVMPPSSALETNTMPSGAEPGQEEITPATLFRLLPAIYRQGDPKYVAQDAFGYSFLSDVFMADYKKGDETWQGFLRPYRDGAEAKGVLEKYIVGVKKDGADVRPLKADGVDDIVISNNIGLVDVIFRKGNTLAGANGATSAPLAEEFARHLARSLPKSVPALSSGN
jgi:hypothetical protein